MSDLEFKSQNPSDILITELEENLKSDFNGDKLKYYIMKIDKYKKKIDKKLVSGCRLEDYKVLDSIKKSWMCAESVLYSLSERISNSL